MRRPFKNLPKPLSIFVLIVFVGMMIFGFMGSAMAMGGDHGSMAGCPLMSEQVTLCAMSILEHWTVWKQVMVMMVVSGSVFLLGWMVVQWGEQWRWKEQGRVFVVFSRFKERYRTRYRWRLFERYHQALRRGLMHPKIDPLGA